MSTNPTDSDSLNFVLNLESNSAMNEQVKPDQEVEKLPQVKRLFAMEKFWTQAKPYSFSLLRQNGSNFPVYPYTVSVLGNLEISDSSQKDAVSNLLKEHLLQVIQLWEKRAGKEMPFILLFPFSGDTGRIVKGVATDLQNSHPCLNLMEVLLPDEKDDKFVSDSDFIPVAEKHPNPIYSRRHIWKLTEEDLADNEDSKPRFYNPFSWYRKLCSPQQSEQKLRSLYEILAVHSHLMIVLLDKAKEAKELHELQEQRKAQNEVDLPDEGPIEWVVCLKLEGNYGNLPHKDSDKHTDPLTYPAVGPVLHIDTGRAGTTSYYYADGTKISLEYDKPLEEDKPQENPKEKNKLKNRKRRNKISLLGLSRFLVRSKNIAMNNDIIKNITILGKLNRKIIQGHTCLIENDREVGQPVRNKKKWFSSRNSIVVKSLTEFPDEALDTIPPYFIEQLRTEDSSLQFMYHFLISNMMAKTYQNRYKEDLALYLKTLRFILYGSACFIFFAHLTNFSYGISIWYPDSLFAFFHSNASICAWLCVILWSLSILSLLYGLFLVFRCFIRSLFCNHDYYHAFRMLAETLWVQICWRISGVESTVTRHFHSHQVDSLKWVRVALNGLDVVLPVSHKKSDSSKNEEKPDSKEDILANKINSVNDYWVKDSINFFNKEIPDQKESVFTNWLGKKLGHTSEWWHYCFRMFNVAIFLIIICGQPLLDNFCDVFFQGHNSNHEIYGMYAWLFPVVWTFILQIYISVQAIKYIRGKMSLNKKRDAKYKSLLAPFRMAASRLESTLIGIKSKGFKDSKDELTTEEKFQSILLVLGEEILAKNADWFLAAEEQELTKPKIR